MTTTKVSILNRYTSAVLYEGEHASVRDAVVAAVGWKINLRGANLRGADLSDANLRDADLGGAYLRGADLGGAYLRDADLRAADLRAADLRDANLRDADLGDANLGDADLRAADLGDADLGAAYLRDADLGGAYLRGADLGGAYLRDADPVPAGWIRQSNSRLSRDPSAPAVAPAEPRPVLTAEEWQARPKPSLAERAAEYRAAHPEVPVVDDLDVRMLAAITAPGHSLAMGEWHTCETTHCRAGWAITLAGNAGRALEASIGLQRAGAAIYRASTGRSAFFFASDAEARADIERRAAEALVAESP